MSEAGEKDAGFEELASLVRATFPDIRCLRCGFDTMYIVSDRQSGFPGANSVDAIAGPLLDPEHPFVVLACARCGYVEHHVTGILRKADKPIVPGSGHG